jgi:hypothetical protein
MPTTGGKFTGDFSIDGAAGSYRQFSLDVGGVKRWTFQKDDVAEASGAGSNLRISSRNDDGTFKSTVLYADRGTGQVAVGTTTPSSSSKLSVAGSMALKNITSPPVADGTAAFLYSEGGVAKVIQGDGTAFPLTAALPTTGGTLSGELSVDGAAGTYREFSFKSGGVKRWSVQAENSSEAAGDGTGSDFRIFSRNNDGTFNLTGLSITRKWAQTTFGDGGALGDAKSTTGGAHGLRNMTWEPALPNEGVLLYARNGVPYVKQGNGTVFALAPAGTGPTGPQGPAGPTGPAGPSLPQFEPADLGLAAWAYDPAVSASDGRLPGTSARVTAVTVKQTTTVSKIAFHFFAYAGGITTGSWAGIYDSVGNRKAATADIVGTSQFPTVTAAGGQTVSVPLTASVSLAPGVYYIVWRFQYTTNGPTLLQLENNGATPPNNFGLTVVRRFGVYSSGLGTAAPATITVLSMEVGANRFWAGLA